MNQADIDKMIAETLIAAGLDPEAVNELREARARRALAIELIEIGYQKLVVRRPEHLDRLKRIRVLALRDVKRLK